jgi:hypothetical protein
VIEVSENVTLRPFTRRAFLVGLGATAALPLLAACQPSVEKEIVEVEKEVTRVVEKPVEVEKQVTRVVEKEVEKIVEVPKQMARIDMPISSWWGDLPNQTIDKWNEKFGDRWTLRHEMTNWGQYQTKLTTQTAAGTAAPINMIDGLFNGENFKSGGLVPLDDVLNAGTAGAFDFDVENYGIDPRRENAWNGKTWSVAVNYTHKTHPHVNKEITDELGISLPAWGTDDYDQWDYPTFLDFLTKLKIEKDGKIDRYPMVGSYYWMNSMATSALDWYDDIWSLEETKCTVNEPAQIQAVQEEVDLSTKLHHIPTKAESEAFTGNMWFAGKSVVRWTWPNVMEEAHFEVEPIADPWKKVRFTFMGANQWAVNVSSVDRDIALEVLMGFSTDWDVGETFTKSAYSVAYKPKEQVEGLPDGLKKTLERIILSRNPHTSLDLKATEGLRWSNRIFGGKEPVRFLDVMNNAVDSILLGEKTTQGAMDDVVAEIDPLLK